MPTPLAQVKGELVDNISDFIQKRKQPSEENMITEKKIYTCEYTQCPYNDIRVGFQDRSSRNNHQMNCMYRGSSQGLVMSNFQINNGKSAIFPMPFAQTKLSHPPPPVNRVPPPFSVSRLRLPEDGQRMISDLMSFYDTNVQQNQSGINSVNLDVHLGDHNLPQQQSQPQLQPPNKFQMQQLNEDFFGHSVTMGGNNVSAETNISMSLNSSAAFQPTDFRFDHCKTFDSSFDTTPNDSTLDFRFGSPFNLGGAVDHFPVGPHPKQDLSMWYL